MLPGMPIRQSRVTSRELARALRTRLQSSTYVLHEYAAELNGLSGATSKPMRVSTAAITKKEFEEADDISRASLSCWAGTHPTVQSSESKGVEKNGAEFSQGELE